MLGPTLLSLLLSAAATTTLAAPFTQARGKPLSTTPSCPIIFDGRIPLNTTPSTFDSLQLFNPGFVKGNDLPWSSILLFPKSLPPSRFDGKTHTPVEVTLSDKSIFQKQLGFRRAGLQFINDSSTGEGGKGIKTLHWSVKQDASRPLNLTHEYLNAWHEAADFSANQIQFQTGTLIGKNGSAASKNQFKILDRANKQLWGIKIESQKWQNFAVTLNYAKNQTTIYYSTDAHALQKVAGPLSADLSGLGQFQIGILKKPTGTQDVVNSGYQSPNLNEGQIYGGLFLEDSVGGCVSL